MTAEEFAITWDWESAPAVRLSEHRVTWARLEIWVRGQSVTLVEDLETGSSRRSIYCPLYPLAEWIAFQWWLLIADSRPLTQLADFRLEGVLPLASDGLEKFRRHNLRSVGDGFSWPDLLIVPEGPSTRLVWRRDMVSRPGQTVRFLNEGEAVVDAAIVRRTLSSLVEAVLTRLSEQRIQGTVLAEEWQSVSTADSEEEAFNLASARLGLDPYSEGLDHRAEILAVADKLHGEVYEDFLNAVNPDGIGAGLDWVGRGVRTIASHKGQGTNRSARLRQALSSQINDDLANAAVRPWHVGYRQAKATRTYLEIPVDGPLDLTGLVLSRKRMVDDRGLQALGGSTDGRGPLVVLGRPYGRDTERFTLARALWHAIYGEESVFLVTGAYTDRQKIDRAFAAELLAPAEGIGRRLNGVSEIGTDDVERIARHYRVPPVLIWHQLENQLVGQIRRVGSSSL